MSSEWKTLPIGEVCDFFNGKGISKSDYVQNSPIPVMGANGILGYTDKSLIDTPATLIGRVGSCGAIHKTTGACWVSDNAIIAKANDRCLQAFLHYFFKSIDFSPLIQGSTQPLLTQRSLLTLTIDVPSINEQKEIANILGTLDDKIELNRKTNETLEAMAKALFKSWFVDFDPVRAKAEGRSTGLPSGISDLFPDSFEDSEVGEIPSEWSVEELGDCSLNIESGKRPKGGIDKDLSFGIPSIGAESIAPVGLFDFSKTKWVETAFAESASKGWIQNFDVALYKDGGKPGEFRPRIAIYGDGFPFERAMVNEHVFLLRSECLGQPFLYHLFNSELILDQIIQRGSSKGAQPGLNQDEVRTTLFVKPDQNLLDAFNDIVKPIIKRQLVIGRECQALSRVRDALLPELISGEIQIPDAVKFLEQVDI